MLFEKIKWQLSYNDIWLLVYLCMASFCKVIYYDQATQIWLQNIQMEISKSKSSLQQKLQLLKALRSGKLQQSQKILANLSSTSRTNPSLYTKFYSFLSKHRSEIECIENQEKEQQPKIVFVDGSDDSWVTDDSISLSSYDDEIENEEPQQKNQQNNERRLMKNVTNTKSTILLQNAKEIKRPFLVQTKMKDTKGLTSNTLKHRGSSLIKLDAQNKSLLATLSKSNLLTKNLTKQASKPYFPPINGAKFILKLQK